MQIKIFTKKNRSNKKHLNSVFSKLTSSQAHKLTQGFTLIEIMVAVSIFAMVMVVAIGAVLSIVSANKKAQAVSSVITNLNFALEAMVRDLRTGYDYDCGGADVSGTDCEDIGSSRIRFISTQSSPDDNPVPVEYNLEGGKINKSIDIGDALSLTSEEVEINELTFYVIGTTKASAPEPDYNQPRIIIVLKGSYKGFGGLTEFYLQTMVSQRRIDI